MKSVARSLSFLFCLAAVGCQTAEKAAHSDAVSVEAGESGSKMAKRTPSVAASSASAKAKTLGTTVADFKAPFPERNDMFEPPKRDNSTVRRDDEHGQSVELKGFINVDQPRVVLSIDGVITAIPEGGERYGVHVISIQPPNVMLQRGRNRWPATLE
jgi:hypothetical protein